MQDTPGKVQRADDPWPGAPLYLILLAFIPLIGAQFGYGNQVEQLSIVARLRDPGFAPGDFYLDSAAGFGPRIYYAHMLAWLHGLLPMPVIIHGLSVLCNLALGAVTYAAAGQFLGASALGRAMAALLAITCAGFSLGLAGYLRFDSFQPANMAICAGLAGFYLLLTARVWWAALAFAGAALMHPLIGVELAGISYGAAGSALLLTRAPHLWIRQATLLVFSGLLFGAAVILAWVLPGLGASAAPLSDQQFFDILVRFRAPHHYLGLEFPRLAWLGTVIFAGCTGVILALHFRSHGRGVGNVALTGAALVVLVLCAASLWFVDVMESRIWVTAQLFRLLMVLKWVGFLALGWWLADRIEAGGAPEMVLALPILLVSADAHAFAVVLALATMGLIAAGRHLIGGKLWETLIWPGLAVLLVICLYLMRRAGIEEQSWRALVGLGVLAMFFAPRPAVLIRQGLAVLLVGAVLGSVVISRERGLFGRAALKSQFVWADLRDDEADIARLAAGVSPADALWLVPPHMETFRMIAGRGVVVDYTSIPFDDGAMGIWYGRMETLFGPLKGGGGRGSAAMRNKYRAGIDWQLARNTYGASHAVLYAETPWDGVVLGSNASFKLVVLGD